MAKWCGPCRRMDETTWLDPRVVAWIKDHAVAVQIDVDADRDVARLLQVTAFPTVVVLRDGIVAGRVVGFRDGEDLLDAFEFLRTGEALAARLRRTADLENDRKARLKLARALLYDQKWEESLTELLWLWERLPSASDMRVKAVPAYLEYVLRGEPKLRPRIEALREAGQERSRLDWVILNDVLGDERRTMEWFRGAKDDEATRDALAASAPRLVPIVIERGWWTEIGRIFPDAMAELRRAESAVSAESSQDEAESEPGDIRKRRLACFRETACALYGSLVAARKDKGAEELRQEALRVDGSEEMRIALVKAGNRAKWS